MYKYKNVTLLSIGAALVLSLFVFDVSHAVQIDRTKQFAHTQTAGIMNETANAPTTQLASTPKRCNGDGMRRTGAPCQKQSLPGSGEQAVRNVMAAELNGTANAPTTQVASAPIPCRGDGMRRTGAPCTKRGLPGVGGTNETLDLPTIAITASVIFTLAFLLLLMFLAHHTQHPPRVKSAH